jgi:hypothetical protein
MPFLATKTELGLLELRDVLIYYDFPRLFTCANEYGQLYVAIFTGEARNSYSWVYAGISSKRLETLTSGKLDVKDAFTQPESGSVLLVTISPSGDSVVPALPSVVSDTVLPKQGRRLKNTSTEKNRVKNVRHYLSLSDAAFGHLRTAFLDVRQNFSIDKVIADPYINSRFVRRCHELGLGQSDAVLNHWLMRARKSGLLSGLHSEKFVLSNEIADKIGFASELAWQYLSLTKGVSLDDILCDRLLAREFDRLAQSMSPGYKSFEYRWAALQVRKSGPLAKKGVELRDKLNFGPPKKITSVRIKDLPDVSGLYLFLYNNSPLFLSQTESLRDRLEIHFEQTKTKALPEWCWPWQNRPIDLALAELPGLQKSSRLGMEIDQVSLRKPIFNVDRSEAA